MEKKEISLETNLVEIRTIVEKMQQGVGDFDQQLAAFSTGMQLIKECQQYLDDAELSIEMLVKGKSQDFNYAVEGE